uniref:Tubulin--tyrosine ligase-like protein 9 n=1 Tax=Chlamydomonas leiostraca TaxID=1034604 RepID=A0A7S0WWM7_9CHLO|mmetsp:Transcript_32768/g.83153  ORF Transcript_32768/g.83153 Transcript_32768/m.83153 type:complete len:466 (+) Transcript_32768:178-1575(+)|eukprot:CAMPEP_0202858802 /NCGR_PEP_ID=MMETSP1391-20130828/1175_1 /ASSEMBLY_ACC=CAM_ASM_000867 /TAXON_ID=1034604 /ORGANISM="Chlamydomonas leiostraca, Strain SAG 11-49" /LENGTH=465 /DNA_ID=CAMNT_0049537761 /DNA_START=117 /DNA_END=1514 /DNA_ORIENTATION=+
MAREGTDPPRPLRRDERQRPPGPIRWRSSLRNTIYDVLQSKKEWVETENETEWDFFWADKGWIHHELDKMHLNDWQRINHFPNHYELTRKDLLIKNLKRAKKQLEREERYMEAAQYNFFPLTFVVPSEYRMFVEEFKRSGGTWIMKPIGKAQGQGIFLFNKLSQISDWRRDHTWRPDDEDAPETYLAQRYVDAPYLVGGKKFDLRIYALVTSYSPLRVFLYRSGFARFTNTRYSMKKEDITNTFIHLTNVAIQKHAPGFDAAKGMKWSIHSLRHFMTTRHGAEASNELFHNMQNLIIRALLAVQPAMINDKHCFELYGYDILIDQSLKPWLLEVNASPSLSASDTSDWTLKFALLEDVLDIVDLESKREPGKIDLHMGGFDLIWDGGPVMRFDKPTSLPTMLGAYNERDRNQLRPKEDGPSHLPTQRPKRAAVSVPTSGATSGTEGGPPQAPPGAGGAAFAASLF